MIACIRISVILSAVVWLAGCSTLAGVQPGDYPPSLPPQPVVIERADGALYDDARALSLFDDIKARKVGDTLTVVLNESMQASKSAQTDTSKNSDFSSGSPTILGDMVTRNGEDVLNNAWESEQTFEGSGSSKQSNELNGRITVTVAEVYPNGNLYVRGEKWLTLNQGREYVQVAGIVRPADIGTDNSVPSYKVADARITYSGNGAIADSNRPGFLARVFMKVWPL